MRSDSGWAWSARRPHRFRHGARHTKARAEACVRAVLPRGECLWHSRHRARSLDRPRTCHPPLPRQREAQVQTTRTNWPLSKCNMRHMRPSQTNLRLSVAERTQLQTASPLYHTNLLPCRPHRIIIRYPPIHGVVDVVEVAERHKPAVGRVAEVVSVCGAKAQQPNYRNQQPVHSISPESKLSNSSSYSFAPERPSPESARSIAKEPK